MGTVAIRLAVLTAGVVVNLLAMACRELGWACPSSARDTDGSGGLS